MSTDEKVEKVIRLSKAVDELREAVRVAERNLKSKQMLLTRTERELDALIGNTPLPTEYHQKGVSSVDNTIMAMVRSFFIDFKDGQYTPSEVATQLDLKHPSSRVAVRQYVGRLVREGLLIRLPGSKYQLSPTYTPPVPNPPKPLVAPPQETSAPAQSLPTNLEGLNVPKL